jgi:hypothetical protein
MVQGKKRMNKGRKRRGGRKRDIKKSNKHI